MKKSLILRIEEAITGFTLAEVLITLTIIGVIAALTIPSLITNIQDQQYRTAWKKAYSDINQATSEIKMDNGGTMLGAFQNDDDFVSKYITHFTYVKRCVYTGGQTACWHSGQSLHQLNGDPENFWANDDEPGFISSNGMLFYFRGRGAGCPNFSSPYDVMGPICGQIMVDVNGFKPPNTMGKDVFGLWIQPDRIMPYGADKDNFSMTNKATCNSQNGTGWGCSAFYLKQ